MSLRATWKGLLKVGMASIPVRRYAAIDSNTGVSFNQLHDECNHRLKQKMTCPACNVEVGRDHTIKGYNVGSDKEPTYVTLTQDEIDAVAVESSHALVIDTFVDENAINPVYIEKADYIGPDGDLAVYDFSVLRDAMQGKVGIAKMAERGREHIVAIKPMEKGLCVFTLHTQDEVRPMSNIDELTRTVDVRPDDVKLARSFLVDPHVGKLDLSAFQDRYAESLRKVIDAKMKGQPLPTMPKPTDVRPSSMMDVLRQSLAKAGAETPKAIEVTPPPVEQAQPRELKKAAVKTQKATKKAKK